MGSPKTPITYKTKEVCLVRSYHIQMDTPASAHIPSMNTSSLNKMPLGSLMNARIYERKQYSVNYFNDFFTIAYKMSTINPSNTSRLYRLLTLRHFILFFTVYFILSWHFVWKGGKSMKYLLMSLPREYFTVLISNANEIPFIWFKNHYFLRNASFFFFLDL